MLNTLRSWLISVVVWLYQEKPLWGHASRGDDLGVWALLEQGMDPNFGDRGETPLMAAASHSYDSVVRLLISRGADVNLSDSTGETALFKAVSSGWRPDGSFDDDARLRTIEALLIAGAAVNVDDNRIKSRQRIWVEAPLNWAMRGGKADEKLVELLLEYGAKISPLKFEDLIEPLIIARRKAGGTISQKAAIARLAEMSRAELLALRGNADVIDAFAEIARSDSKDHGK